MFTNRYFLGALTFSLIVHFGAFASIAWVKKPIEEVEYEEIREVSFYDPSQRPEVARVVGGGGGGSGTRPTGGGGGASAGGSGTGSGGPVAYMPPIPGYQDLTEADVASSAQAAKLAGTSARIDVSRYAVDDGSGMDVIRLADKSGGRTGATTDEILAQPALALARGVAGSGGGGGSGYAIYGGGAAGAVPRLQPEEPVQPVIPAADLSKRIDRSKKIDVTPEPARPQENVAPATAPRKSSVSISGQISQRGRISSPLPKYPDWAVKQGASGTVVVRIVVAPDGTVRENPTLESTSGYPALDELVLNALRRWRFAPLEPTVAQEDQWGRITVRFVLG